jgi:hypothetical protein
MNRYTGNEPIEPFHVPAKTIRCSMSSGDMAGGSGPATPPPRQSPSMLDDLDSPLGRIAMAAVLVGTYILVHARPAMSAITVFVLLSAVMYRLDPRLRRIGAAPISLATAMLASQIVTAGIRETYFASPSMPMMPDGATSWVPLFLAACLAFSPKFPTCTEKIMMIISLIVLGSGLLPGHGFEAIFATMQYFLFIAVAVGLGVDFKENGGHLVHQAAAK